MLVDSSTFSEILLNATCFFSVYFLFYRKYVYSVLDPIFLYVVGLSFSSVLVISFLEYEPSYMYHFFICQLSIFVGYSQTISILKKRWLEEDSSFSKEFFDYYSLRLTVYILFAIYLFANIVLFYSTGFALLSDDPTVAKVENFTQGYGIILVINWGVGGFILPAVLFFVLYKPKYIDYILLLIVVSLTALDGSKSALLRILIMLFLWINHPLFKDNRVLVNRTKLLAPLGAFAAFAVVFAVLSKENNSSEDAYFAFVKRLVYGADSVLTFYLPVNEQFFSRIRFWEYPSHFFNGILGFLRVVPNREAYGNVMIENAFPDRVGTIVGPNTPYYIEGQIFFGYYGAFIYSLVVGGCYALIREYFFKHRFKSAFWLVLACGVCQQAGALYAEVTFFVISAFYTCFFVIPIYFIVSLTVQGKIRLTNISSLSIKEL